jgi:protein-glutamine gamma-glutamyltransferase
VAFDLLFRSSLYLTLIQATVLLTVDSVQNSRFGLLYPLAACAGAAVAFLTVDRDSRKGIPRDVGNFLALIGAIFGLLEWYNDPNSLLHAFGHTLVYFQLVYYFLHKDVEVDWILFLISLVEAVIGVLVNHSDVVGFLVIAWSISSLWTFGLFFLRREAVRGGPPPGVTVTPSPVPGDPYPGLVNLAFVLSMLRIAAATLVLGSLIFFVMPRWPVRGNSRFGSSPTEKHLTGFSREVQLGQMGQILENENVVMSVEFSDAENNVVTPDPDILLRGLTLTQYRDKIWTREETDGVAVERLNATPPPPRSILRQRYKMEGTDSEVLFAVRPILRVQSTLSGDVVMNRNDGSLYRRDARDDFGENVAARPNKFDYTVISSIDGAKIQRFETFNHAAKSANFTNVPPGIVASLKEITDPILATLRPEVRGSHLEQAKAMERHLRDGEYTYTLRMGVVDADIDPVLDFLKNRKEGHCEYFASALALMCRVQGIPSRLVNGFKGGDWDELGRVLHVREKHAHSWVEVLVSDSAGKLHWETLDPTPSRQRAEVVAQVGASTKPYRYLSDKIRTQWIFYVIGFDSDRQEAKIYGPIRAWAANVAQEFRLLGRRLRDAASWFYFDNIGQFFSVRGFFVACAAMLLLVGFFVAGSSLVRRVLGRSRSGGSADEALDPSLAFYHRLVKILADLGVERPASETPREFARRAGLALEALPAGSAFSLLPGSVVEVFYAKRFGLREPDGEFLQDVASRLGALERSLSEVAES